MNRVGYFKDSKDKKYGISSRLYCTHNKCRPPLGSAEVDIIWGYGIDIEQALVDGLIDRKLLKRKGAWYSIKIKSKEYTWQGKEEIKKEIKSSEVLRNELTKQLYSS